jgi:hypothetical protein
MHAPPAKGPSGPGERSARFGTEPSHGACSARKVCGLKHILILALATAGASAVASPFATQVVSYAQGSNANGSYTNAANALGSASRMTGFGDFISGVTPFNPPFATNQLVSIGSGGHLTLGFEQDIVNGATHRFGVDLIVFSNAFFVDQSFFDTNPTNDGSGVLGPNPAVFGSSGIADIYVSADGQDWRLASATSLNLFPTLGYSDFTETTPLTPGTVETDFTRAMDPTMTPGSLSGLSFAELIDLYDGSGGGVGIDISGTGLDFARFVRIENNSASAFNIDAVAVVPAPGAVAFGVFGLAFAARRRR